MSRQKTICFFGIYDSAYSRNKVLRKGLEESGIRVMECRSEAKSLKKFWDLYSKHKTLKNDYDYLLVAFPGQVVMPLAWLISRKKIIFDAFTSLYDSNVFDRQTVNKDSLKARWYWLLDWLACRLADKILCDTNANIEYFSKTFRINKKKFLRVFLGCGQTDPKKIKPRERSQPDLNKSFVHFHGSYIPLQGVETIIAAARQLEKYPDVKFQVVGTKIKKRYEPENYPNIEFVSNQEFEKLLSYIARADICLGIFGNTPKTKRVIPNKVYEAAAMGKAIITADTPAIRELFTDRENILLCQVANTQDLVEKILFLKGNFEFREKISNNSIDPINRNLDSKNIVKKIVEYA